MVDSNEALSVGASGDRVAYTVADDNLRLVSWLLLPLNPLQITGRAWQDIAQRGAVNLVVIEVVR